MWWFGGRTNHLPEATGPSAPGCMDVMLDYSQDGIFVRLYYPTNNNKTDSNNSNRWLSWIPDDNYIIGIAKVLMSFTFVIRLAFWWSSGVIPVIYGGRAKVDKKLKCIVLSHGLGGHRSLYSNTCCELASRGFLVVALEHRDGSACFSYYYKSKEDAQNRVRTEVEYEPFALGEKHHKQRKRQVDYRAKECGKAVEFLVQLNNGMVPHNVISDVPTKRQIDFRLEDFVGKLDLDSFTMAGHSFGGATALLTLSQRPELKQGVLLDPWMYPIKNDKLDEKLEQPMIFINTQTFHIASNTQAMSQFLTGSHRSMYTIL
jgi:platelet-activating factor acetylhydrolase